MSKKLYVLIMLYYGDIQFLGGDYIADCQVHIDRELPGLAINYLKSGSIYFQVGDQKCRTIEAPAVYWTWDGCRFKYGPTEHGNWEHYWIHAIGTRCLRLVQQGVFPVSNWPVYHPLEECGVLERMKEILSILKTSYPINHNQCVWLLEGIGVEIQSKRISSEENANVNSSLTELIEMIQQRPELNYDFQSLANKMGYSYSHFRRIFQSQTGSAPQHYLLHCRMLLAAQKLSQQQRIKDVAYELGYDNIHHFSKLFKSKIGLSPRQFVQTLVYSG